MQRVCDVLSANDSVNSNWNSSDDEFNRLVCANLAEEGSFWTAAGTATGKAAPISAEGFGK